MRSYVREKNYSLNIYIYIYIYIYSIYIYIYISELRSRQQSSVNSGNFGGKKIFFADITLCIHVLIDMVLVFGFVLVFVSDRGFACLVCLFCFFVVSVVSFVVFFFFSRKRGIPDKTITHSHLHFSLVMQSVTWQRSFLVIKIRGTHNRICRQESIGVTYKR